MKANKELLIVAHLSQLLDLVTVIGGFLAPLTIWLLKTTRFSTLTKILE